MATSFLSRWSKRKLEESTRSDANYVQNVDATPSAVPNVIEQNETQDLQSDEASTLSSERSTDEPSNAEYNVALSSAEVAQSGDETLSSNETTLSTSQPENSDEEEPSIAALLVSEASESVKKAALRKLFLSEEFNVRDGLDDYDDDYSNLTSLSKEVADTLRDWVRDETEPELEEDAGQAHARQEERVAENNQEIPPSLDADKTDIHDVDTHETTHNASEDDGIHAEMNTSSREHADQEVSGSDTASLSDPHVDDLNQTNELGQNIPHKK